MDMSRILATSDIVFKYLFGAKSSTELLRRFVNAVQRHAGMEEFSALEIINPIGEREYYSAKPTIIDVKAKVPDGTVINVEVQVRTQADYGERSLYYWAKSYTEQIGEGDQYRKLMPVVSVSVLDFPLFPEKIPYHSTFRLLETKQPDVCLTDDCVLHYLELKKLPADDESELAEWLYVLRHIHEKEVTMEVLLKRNHSLQELADRYHRFEKSSDARLAYDARMKEQSDRASEIYEAEVRATERGMAKGLEQGLSEGMALGAKRKAWEVARALRAEGLPLAKVASLSGLSESEISADSPP